jgi:undecaprenyl-diphosphatase
MKQPWNNGSFLPGGEECGTIAAVDRGRRQNGKEAGVGLIEALVLGIVQGLTEFLPVSSTGHLVLVSEILRRLLGWNAPSGSAAVILDTILHLGTLLAVLVVFWRDLIQILVAWWQGLRRRRPLETAPSRLAWWIILGTVPAALAGVLLEETFTSLFGSPHAVGGFLLLTALLLVLAEVLGRRRRELEALTWLDGLLVGVGQAAAIAPGLSRSGTTMAVGMFRGLTREAAVRFSFLLSVPIIAGTGLVQLFKLVRHGGLQGEALALLVGFLAAAICGYAAIRLLLAYVRKRPLYPFAVYCVVLGLAAILFL